MAFLQIMTCPCQRQGSEQYQVYDATMQWTGVNVLWRLEWDLPLSFPVFSEHVAGSDDLKPTIRQASHYHQGWQDGLGTWKESKD
jgi:hypothetical protein